MPSHRKIRSAVAATATIAAVLGAAGSAVADSATATPSTTSPSAKSTNSGIGGSAKALCRRVPRIDSRIDRALARLNGPVTERGSIARLQKRVDTATSKGQTAVEKFLSDKLTFRKSLLPMLNQRSTDLDAVRTWCDAQGVGAKSATK